MPAATQRHATRVQIPAQKQAPGALLHFFFFFFPITKDRDKLMTEILPQGESPVDKMEKEPASRLNCTPIVLLPMTLECNTPAECQRILFAKVPARWAVKVR